MGGETGVDLLVKMSCSHADPAGCLPDSTVLTQLSDRDHLFRNEPRHWRERSLSLIIGHLEVADAYEQVTGSPGEFADPDTRVRHCTVGALRLAGFLVIHAPGSRSPENPHASVCVTAGNWRADQRIPWNTDIKKSFDACFDADRR